MDKIDWKVVSQNLKCPQCGESAHIDPESDGTSGSHTHHFSISRAHARELTQQFAKPSYEELEKRLGDAEHNRIKLTRMWVNQPSTLQRWHAYHGMNVLVALDSTMHSDAVQVWFSESQPVVGMNMARSALSMHWKNK